MPRSIARVIKESSALALVLSLSLSLSLARALSLSHLSRGLSLSRISLSLARAGSLSLASLARDHCWHLSHEREPVSRRLLLQRAAASARHWRGAPLAKHLCVCARVCERASERERARAREGNERARGSEREESERASSTRRAAALRSRDVLWNSFILCACGPATPPHNLRGCPHGWAAGFLPDRSTSFRALAQPARRWWPQRAGVTQIHSGITQRANSAVQTIRSYAKARMLRNVTQSHHSTKEVPLPKKGPWMMSLMSH